ncbi:dUTP diphosphatase [Bacillus sp. Marseille-P3661]|uniref:dUTP diphosphatase n=1 Tax=Bacillus sp. Marseille-P3661 TaxID=1936234 RepID=UPI000C84FB38|nr:dUTP diphosphatase [Bacillus sp. Marseille-P3661]
MFEELFQLQKELDERILKEHELHNENLMDRKIMALLVELGELANETRCFKFWSKKPPADRDVILEEYVDGIHFILSLGLDLNVVNKLNLGIGNQQIFGLVDQFHVVYKSINELRENQQLQQYQKVFNEYLILGDLLGFSWKDIKEAYISKNEVNHQRQDQGY